MSRVIKIFITAGEKGILFLSSIIGANVNCGTYNHAVQVQRNDSCKIYAYIINAIKIITEHYFVIYEFINNVTHISYFVFVYVCGHLLTILVTDKYLCL